MSRLVTVIAGAVLFNLVFWQEKMGINTVLFDLFILIALLNFYPQARSNNTVRWLILGHLLCLTMVVVQNTELSKISLLLTLFLVAGFAEYVHRSAWFAGGSVILNILLFAASFVEQIKLPKGRRTKRRLVSRIIRFAFFPLAILFVFFIIYLSANSVFLEMANRAAAKLGNFLAHFFDLFSLDRILFLLLGLFITGSILLKSRIEYFARKESRCNDNLQRKKISLRERMKRPFFFFIKNVMGRFSTGNLALQHENTTGIISLVLLNILLLIINSIDISYLWFKFDYMGDVFLTKMVHEGAELLIVSIVLAMLVLLFFFKGNLNFYKKNKWLKYGAYAWIAQNSILVISVFLRDFYYIARYGLAYKRIGVLFFLLMVLIGLVTVLLKITFKKTNYFLFRINAWAAISILVIATTINWDAFIADWNLQRKDKIPLDTAFLLSLSDRTLPALDKNLEALKKNDSLEHSYGERGEYKICDTCVAEQLHDREIAFVKEQENLSWLSWNYADSYTKEFLRNKGMFPGKLHN